MEFYFWEYRKQQQRKCNEMEYINLLKIIAAVVMSSNTEASPKVTQMSKSVKGQTGEVGHKYPAAATEAGPQRLQLSLRFFQCIELKLKAGFTRPLWRQN